ncbi:hypothetical protein C0995_005821 [Termitomyces sp. Mi166|nr:hypothetical protein C0995_005821 [Termitomyces sp. Mi166\
MSIAFPAGGNLYYAKDLKKVAGRPGIPLEDKRFCVGPDTRLSLWYGGRSQIDVDRGPYESAEAVLVRAADKERLSGAVWSSAVKHAGVQCAPLRGIDDPYRHSRRHLFSYASDPWQGETLALKVALIEATENWETLTGGYAPCLVVFDTDDVRETIELAEVQRGADEVLTSRNIIDCGLEGWVPIERSEKVMARKKQMKVDVLAMTGSDEERAEIAAHWP